MMPNVGGELPRTEPGARSVTPKAVAWVALLGVVLVVAYLGATHNGVTQSRFAVVVGAIAVGSLVAVAVYSLVGHVMDVRAGQHRGQPAVVRSDTHLDEPPH